MREAWHKNDKKIYLIPQTLSKSEVENHKQIAKKGTFSCPYCEARLTVKSGEIPGNYFSHLHGEGCQPAKQSEARFRKYEKLKKDDTPRHSQILALMYNELEVLSKIYPQLSVSYAYLNHNFNTYIPDLFLKINDHKYAITIVTNITSSTDLSIAKNIFKQRRYYESLGCEALFFVEKNNLGFDIDEVSIVLWETEREVLTTQKTSLHWQRFLSQLAPLEEQKLVLRLPNTNLNVKTIMYITPANQEIAIEAFHVLEQPDTTPTKAYFLCDPYTLTFSKAFKLDNDSLCLSDYKWKSKNNQSTLPDLKKQRNATSKNKIN